MSTLSARLAISSVALTCLVAFAQGQSAGSNAAEAAVRIDGNAETLLVAYLEIVPELAEQDRTPLVRIYGDGTVRVHRPRGTRGAGSYETRLESAELDRLLVTIARAFDGFETRAVKDLLRQAENARVAASLAAGVTPVFHGVSDDSISVFELHLLGYRAAGSTLFAGEIHREVSWLGLATDAARFPSVEPIQRLREVELALRALFDREDLERSGS